MSGDDEFDGAKSFCESEGNDRDQLESLDSKEKIARLQSALKANPRERYKRLELINLLRDDGDIDELHAQRKKMAEDFLLGEDFWIQWLEDEQFILKLNGMDQSKTHLNQIFDLYARAIEDYVSVPLYVSWIEYLNGLMLKLLEQNGAFNCDKIQNVDMEDDTVDIQFLTQNLYNTFENAIDGLYGEMNDVGIVWKYYREFEELLNSSYDENNLEQRSIKKIRSLFIREFENPHSQVLNIYKCEYLPWENTVGKLASATAEEVAYIAELIEKARNFLLDRAIFEEQINNSDPNYLNTSKWREYLSFEHAKGNFERLAFVYERAIKKYPLSEEFWISYCFFLIDAFSKGVSIRLRKFSVAQLIENTLVRATKNAPNTHTFWCLRIAVSELTKTNETEINKILGLALSQNLNLQNNILMIYKQYLDYKIRSIHTWDENCKHKIRLLIQETISYFDEYAPSLAPEIYAYAAIFELNELKDSNSAVGIYEALATRYGHIGSVWTDYIGWAANNLDSNDLVKLLNRAIREASIQPELVWKMALDVSRLSRCGLMAYFSIWKVCIEKYQQYSRISETTNRRKMFDFQGHNSGEQLKRAKYSDVQGQMKDSMQNFGDSKGQNSDCKAMKVDAFERMDSKENNQKIKNKNERANRHLALDTVTLHVLGIPQFCADEKLLRSIFEEFGEIREIRYVYGKNEVMKNYCFVTFESSAGSKAVMRAVKDGHDFSLVWNNTTYPLKITRAFALPETLKSEFKTRVFVSNLSPLTSDLSLELLFRQKGIPIPISLRRPKNEFGEYRNFAYFEYQNSDQVMEACKLLDNLDIDGRIVKAAPSNPKKGKKSILTSKNDVEMNNNYTSSNAPKAVPRSVQRRKLNIN